MTASLLIDSRVHAEWTRSWWSGDRELTSLFGPAPTDDNLGAHLSATPNRAGWTRSLDGLPTPEDAVVVLAGQQPGLVGGALLVAHKAATAVALARRLQLVTDRPVVPVFLLATQDHDTSEIDHLDLIDDATSILVRLRCRVRPRHEQFSRARWDRADLDRVYAHLSSICTSLNIFESASSPGVSGAEEGIPIADPVRDLLLRAFGPLGLRVVDAHRLGPRVPGILNRALDEAESSRSILASGARALAALNLVPAFDPADVRPLVLESRNGRRQRLRPDDLDAARRLRDHPDDFSPHAALRPIVQALALPVVAQVCGPSELLYLAQARALHEQFDAWAPLLVPRMEGTRVVPPADAPPTSLPRVLAEAAESLRRATAPDPPTTPRPRDEDASIVQGVEAVTPAGSETTSVAASAGPNENLRAPAAELHSLQEAANRFVLAMIRSDAELGRRAQRITETFTQRARRLAETPSFRSGRLVGFEHLRPRGRHQDSVLAWVTEAWRDGDPVGWARQIVDLCHPTEPPRHVVYIAPRSPRRDVAAGPLSRPPSG